MNSRRIVLMTAILAAMIAFGGLWNATWADEAPRTTERQFDFPSVGLAMGQTARMNVSNLGTEPMMVQFLIYDQRGQMLLPAVQKVIEPGHTEWVDLPSDGLLLPAVRQQIRSAIKVEGLKGPISDKSIGGSLEVFDTRTGRAIIAINLLRFMFPTDQLPTDQKTGNLLPAV
jgi:hypothetical protein